MSAHRTGAGSIVLTGLGTVGAWGRGMDALAAALASGSPTTLPVDRSAGLHTPGGATLASRIEKLELAPWLTAGAARRMSVPSRLAIVAARMAFADAGLDPAPRGEALGVSLATAFGTVAFTEKLLREVFGPGGPPGASPFLFAESVANAPAAQLAIASLAQGPNITVTQREAGPLLALAQGAAQIALGRAEVMLAGDVEESNPLVHAVLDRYHALARAGDGLAELPRPFDRRRNGFLLAEGGSVVVLEDEGRARARGARIRCRVAATVGGFDPSASETDWGDGASQLARTLRHGLERAGIDPASLEGVVSGANGSRCGDRLEAQVLRELFGEKLPPIVTLKAVTGELGGGLLASAVLVLDGAAIAAAAFEAVDPELGITPSSGTFERPPRRILVSALAAGGAAAWVVLDRPGS